MHIEKLNLLFLRGGGLPAEYGAGLAYAIERGWLWKHQVRDLREVHPGHEPFVPSVTGKVYDHSKRMKEKGAVLAGVAAELRRIIGEPVPHGEAAMRLAA